MEWGEGVENDLDWNLLLEAHVVCLMSQSGWGFKLDGNYNCEMHSLVQRGFSINCRNFLLEISLDKWIFFEFAEILEMVI